MTTPRKKATVGKKAAAKKTTPARAEGKPARAGARAGSATVKKAPARTPSNKAAAKRSAPRRRRVDTSRDTQVLELRRQGKPFDQIATQLGFRTRDDVADAYERALAEDLPEPSDQVRRHELERIEGLMEPLWSRAVEGDSEAIAQLASLSTERSRVAADSKPLPEVERDREAGPVEAATLKEIHRLRVGSDNQLAATAVILARGVDDTAGENSIAGATIARELRMTMGTLRGIAGTAGTESHGEDGKPKGETVVPESRLAALREKAQVREQSRR